MYLNITRARGVILLKYLTKYPQLFWAMVIQCNWEQAQSLRVGENVQEKVKLHQNQALTQDCPTQTLIASVRPATTLNDAGWYSHASVPVQERLRIQLNV